MREGHNIFVPALGPGSGVSPPRSPLVAPKKDPRMADQQPQQQQLFYNKNSMPTDEVSDDLTPYASRQGQRFAPPTPPVGHYGARERNQNAAVSFREHGSRARDSPSPSRQPSKGSAAAALLSGGGYRPQDAEQYSPARNSIGSQRTNDDLIERSAAPTLGPMQIKRLSHIRYPPIVGGYSGGDALPAKPVPVIWQRTETGVLADATGTALAQDPSDPTGNGDGTGATASSSASAMAAVAMAKSGFYGNRGDGSAEAQAAAEKADEVAPVGFRQVALGGGLYNTRILNVFLCTALIMLLPMIYLLTTSSILFKSSVLRSHLQQAVEVSMELDIAVAYLAVEQAYAAYMNVLPTIKGNYEGDDQKEFFAAWSTALLYYSDIQQSTDWCFSRADALVDKKEEQLQTLLDNMSPWIFVDVSYLSWARIQCTTNSENSENMDAYDRLQRQVILYNGALALAATVRIESDTEEMRGVFSVQMASIAKAAQLFLQAKLSQSLVNEDAVAYLKSSEEAEFVVQVLAAMRVVEMTLRFANDHMGVRRYLEESMVGTSGVDPAEVPALKFVRMENELYSAGFSDEIVNGLLTLLELTFTDQSYGDFNDNTARQLHTDTNKFAKHARAYFLAQAPAQGKVQSAADAARQACLAALLSMCALGIVFHIGMPFDFFRALDEFKRINHYTRQLRGSLLRMHDAGLKMARLRLSDTTAEVRLSRRPKLRSITAEERELYLGVSMLNQLEPYLPLPVRYPPRGVPAGAVVNQSAFLKPALFAKKDLVAIRVDFSCTRKGATERGRHGRLVQAQQSQNTSQSHTPPLDGQLSAHPSGPLGDLRSGGMELTSINSSILGGDSLTSSRPTTGGNAVSSADSSQIGTPMRRAAGIQSYQVGDGMRASAAAATKHAYRSGATRTTAGAADMAHYTYESEILKVIGALANTRPQLGNHQHHYNHPGAYLQASGAVTTVWLNLCEDVKYANLRAFFICSAVVRYCAENKKPCPELTVCCGDGVVGTVSSYQPEATTLGAATAAASPASNGADPAGNGAPPRGTSRGACYADLWPKSAFFASNAGAGGDAASAGNLSTEDGKAPVEGVVVAVSGSDRAGDANNYASWSEMEMLVVATAGLSKSARAIWWLKQLLGMKVDMMNSLESLEDEGGADYDDHRAGASRKSGSGADKDTGASSLTSGGATAAHGGRGGSGNGTGSSFSTILASSGSVGDGDGGAEKVPLPTVLPPQYAPRMEAACLTSVVVYGEVVRELEAVHAAAEVHGQPVMANDVAVERALRESANFQHRFDALRKRRGSGSGVSGGVSTMTTMVSAPLSSAANSIPPVSDVTLPAPPSDDPLISFAGKDRRCCVDVSRFTAAMRAFNAAFVPVDLVEKQRDYVPVYEKRRAVAASERKKKKNKGREGERRLNLRGELDATPEATPALPELDPNANAEAEAEAEAAAPMDLMAAFPAITTNTTATTVNGEADAVLPYRRDVVTRATIPLPRYIVENNALVADVQGRRRVGFRAVSALRPVFAWVMPSPAEQQDNVTGVLASWMHVFDGYTRLNCVAAATEPNRCSMRSNQEQEQVAAMAEAVRGAIANLQTDLLMHNGSLQLALLGETSVARLMDVTGTIESFAREGPLEQQMDMEAVRGVANNDETHLFPETLLSTQAMDAVRFYGDVSA